jgi:2',3'-cyclic-nucleotide 2'-phosphodiesterase (5'-nucleotidase family)
MRGPSLRLVCVNDVYTLENLPRLRSLVRHHATTAPADVFLVTMAGDFVAPSLLSSLDKGLGMVDCMNAVPVTHAIFGNHEDDVPFEALVARVEQFRGTWINTNIPDFPLALPAHQVLEIAGAGTRTVRVGLVGVVTGDPNLYRPGAFGGHAITPANPSALAHAHALVREAGCACVVPLTHQSLEDDRALARAEPPPAFPAIIGGHEHEPHLEQVGATWIVKAGSEAAHAAVVDMVWPALAPDAGAPDLPAVAVRFEDAQDYPEDAALRARVERHLQSVRDLKATTLLRLPAGTSLSSVGTRARQTSVGAMLCSRVRDALAVDGCVVNGGGIRGASDYREAFTFGDLEAELPFPNEVVAVAMPGRVVRAAIAASRTGAPRPGFLQVDDGMAVGPDHVLTAIAGRPLEDDRDYRIATVRVLFDGMDAIEPLVRFAREHPERVPPRDSGRELKVIVVDAFARDFWRQLGTFDDVDTNHDGAVSIDEIRAAIVRVTHATPPDLLVDRVLQAMDADGDARVSPAESAAAGRGRGPSG